jgi:hypothetical protein
MEIALRQLENKLWKTGKVDLPFLAYLPYPPSSTRSSLSTYYQDARCSDPDFSRLCAAYTQLAKRFREKSRMELELADIERQAKEVLAKYKKVDDECKRIRCEERV